MIFRHNLRMALIEQRQCPSGRAGIDCLPQSVEYQHGFFKRVIHDIVLARGCNSTRIYLLSTKCDDGDAILAEDLLSLSKSAVKEGV